MQNEAEDKAEEWEKTDQEVIMPLFFVGIYGDRVFCIPLLPE